MYDLYESDAMKERLIIAAIRELESHGLNDFSLRRVALACEVSCAAPYRHFKSKEDLIIEIISYINRQWLLLQNQIVEVYANDRKKQLIEIGIAHIRFWIANPNFRSVLLIEDSDPNSARHIERRKINGNIETLIHEYCAEESIPLQEETRICYTFIALIYGTVLLIGNQESDNSASMFEIIRKELNSLLP